MFLDMLKSQRTGNVVIASALCVFVGIFPAIVMSSQVLEWYIWLHLPGFAPSRFIFMPLWITLYILMGTAVALLYEQGWSAIRVRWALLMLAIFLGLNALRAVLFLGLQEILATFVVGVMAWIVLAVAIGMSARLAKLAAGLLIPVWLWMSFALVLNFATWQLNA